MLVLGKKRSEPVIHGNPIARLSCRGIGCGTSREKDECAAIMLDKWEANKCIKAIKKKKEGKERKEKGKREGERKGKKRGKKGSRSSCPNKCR